MGSSTSKTVQKTARRFPTRAPGTATPPRAAPTQQPKLEQQGQPVEHHLPDPAPKSTAYSNPDSLPSADFSERLRRMGIVLPKPTFSPSSTAGNAGRFAPASGRGADGVRGSPRSPPRTPPSPSSLPSSPSSSPPPPPGSPSPVGREVLGGVPAPARFAPAAGNATLAALEARRRLQERVESSEGSARKDFASARTIRDALVLRQRGVPAADVERRLGLKQGWLGRLGEGVVVPLGEGGGAT